MNKRRTLLAVMLDWAGTTVDHGSIAPVLALQTLFAQHGITLASQDARRDMGLLKRVHIAGILSLPNIRSEWAEVHGREPTATDVRILFEEFGPLQIKIITQHSQLISGVKETVSGWKQRGLRIGTTTGYTREMLAPVLALAAENGYRPDISVCPDEVDAGRPAPWMLMRNAQLLDVYPPSCCVKIGDTVSDIEEGLNAGMWTIGLTRTGNLIGLDAADWELLPEAEKSRRVQEAEGVLRNAGAHFVVEDLRSCDEVFGQIELLPKS
ncbi:MAG TPA: phosphonoacetaldehyde hydrolase [Acidobacteriaceae bacterium]